MERNIVRRNVRRSIFIDADHHRFVRVPKGNNNEYDEYPLQESEGKQYYTVDGRKFDLNGNPV